MPPFLVRKSRSFYGFYYVCYLMIFLIVHRSESTLIWSGSWVYGKCTLDVHECINFICTFLQGFYKYLLEDVFQSKLL